MPMRICFIYPNYQKHSESNPEIKDVVSTGSYLGAPTQSIALLAGMTPQHHEVSFYDDRIEDIPFDETFDLVAMPVFTPASTRAKEIGDRFRAQGTKVVVGGVFSSLMPDEMAPHVDAVCIGEGEPVWQQILQDAEDNNLAPVYKAREPMDLNNLPVPRYDLYFQKEGPTGYRSTGQGNEASVDYGLQLSRGCPMRCAACVIPEYMGRKMRFVSPEWLANTMSALGAEGKSRYVSLTEDTTSFPVKKVLEHYVDTMEACKDIGPRISYAGASPAQCRGAKDEYFHYLRKLNANSIYMVFGFDPGSRKAFRANQDKQAYQNCLDSVARVFDNGLEVYASLLVGHDEEDESVFDTVLEFAHRAMIRTAEFVILTPYPGTPLWKKFNKQERILTRDFHLYNDANPVFKPNNFTADRLREGYIYLWKNFYADHGKAKHHIQV